MKKKKSWGKLGFVPATLPWEQPGSDLLDAVVFGNAAHQHGVPFALKMWDYTAALVQMYRDFPDADDRAYQDAIREFLLSLDRQDAAEFVVFNRVARATGRSMAAKKPGACHTYGLLPFGEPIDGGAPDRV